MRTPGFILFLFLPLLVSLQTSVLSQEILQSWVTVYGDVEDTQFGRHVIGIRQSPNLPYRAAVSSDPNGYTGSTYFYRLDDSTDTQPQLILEGENVLTGDLNNDGWDDVVLNRETDGFDTLVVYWGIETGVDTLNPLLIPGETRYGLLRPNVIADLNNDGVDDLVASDFTYGFQAGKLYVFLGPLGNPIPDVTIEGDTILAGLTQGGVSVGDINGDELNDLVIRGWNQFGSEVNGFHYVNIYWGIGPDTVDTDFDIQMSFPATFQVGLGLATIDANGDGIDDLLWTSRDSTADWISVHYGRTEFSTTPDLKLQNPGVADFGEVISNAGDMNGDGYNDIITGSPGATVTTGFLFLFGGGPDIDPYYDAAVGISGESGLGTSVSSLGDITGDGLEDIIAGGPHYPFFDDEGLWAIYKGDSEIIVSDVGMNEVLPDGVTLNQNYPNPFNPKTTISYSLATEAHVTLKVYDILGRELTTLVDRDKPPGEHQATFDGSSLSSGVYHYTLRVSLAGKRFFVLTKAMVLAK